MQRARGATLLAHFVVAVVLVAACCSACSGSSRANAIGQPSPGRQFCDLLTRLDAAGQPVARANVADPVAFNAALASAVQRYTALLQQLRSVAPSQLTPTIERLRREVAQHQFAPAKADHAALATYAASTCH
jgi:hypothetical protein